jgi:poly(A) polymerase
MGDKAATSELIQPPSSSSLNAPQYGVSQPISMEPPTKAEIELTKKLENELKAKDVYETEQELEIRLEVLRRINALVKAWVKHVSVEKGLPPDQVEKAGGKLFTFGSYRLGVYTRGADIDSLCVAPRHVERSDFFSSFFQMLKEDSNVTELHAVEEAFVPLIKLRYNGIELDILFARLALREVGEGQRLDDDSLLRNLDEKSIRSLNGCRVADEILKSIPNQKTFTIALRAVKLWAKNHSIYSNSLGFLGGISWAILVARTCQLYPNATPATIIEKFFLVFGTWDWPHPVFLKDSDTQSKRADIIALNDLVWDPRNRVQDRYHLMPIITPAYPEQNSTFNVTKSTRQIITNEFRDGLQTMFEIVSGEKTWHELLEEVNFFSRYRHFICLICATEDDEDHLVFSSLVESKIRHLIGFFENNSCVNLCHVCPRQFKPLPTCDVGVDYKNPVVTLWFVGLDLNKSMKKNIDLTLEIQQFSDVVLKAAGSTKSYKSTMIVRPFYVKRSDLNKWISKEDLMRGRNYARHRSSVVNISSINQKEIAGEKSTNIMAKVDDLENGDLPNASIPQTSNSQPSSPSRKAADEKFVSPSDPLLIPQLMHSVSTPNLEGDITGQPPPQLPVEHATLSNSTGLMNAANGTTTTASSSDQHQQQLQESRKRKGFFSPPTMLNQTLLAAAKEAAAANATSHLPAATMSTSSDQQQQPPPQIKRPKFNYLSAPQNGTVH